jgi:hypothetical protein
VQIAIDAGTRLVIVTGDPQPGNHHDCTVYRNSRIKDQLEGRPIMADGGCQGNPEVMIPLPQPANSRTGKKNSTPPNAPT